MFFRSPACVEVSVKGYEGTRGVFVTRFPIVSSMMPLDLNGEFLAFERMR